MLTGESEGGWSEGRREVRGRLDFISLYLYKVLKNKEKLNYENNLIFNNIKNMKISGHGGTPSFLAL